MLWDQILASEWKLLEQVATLLKPFADHTRLLEGDPVALSSVIPAAMDLECHLLGFQQDQTKHDVRKVIASDMLSDMRRRFESVTSTHSSSFDPLPAAATFLHQSLCAALFIPGKAQLLQAAKDLIMEMLNEAGDSSDVASTSNETQAQNSEREANSTALSRFRFLSQPLEAAAPSVQQSASSSSASADQRK